MGKSKTKKTKKKKKNPAVSLRRSDVRNMKKAVTEDAVDKAMVFFFTVLHDKWDFSKEDLQKVFRQITELAEMVNQTPHYVTLEQLEKTLQEEAGISFTKNKEELI